jgi:hypothetical protein
MNSVMSKDINQKEREYVEQGGTVCPSCGSMDIAQGFLGGIFEWATVTWGMECEGCGLTWNNRYTLIGCEDMVLKHIDEPAN